MWILPLSATCNLSEEEQVPPTGNIFGTTNHHENLSLDQVPSLRVHELLNVVAGVEYLHSRSPPVIHKDLRCAIVSIHRCVTQPGHRTVARVGGGCLFDSLAKQLSKEEQRLGQPAWSPPEVLLCEQYGTEADIFSLGVLMWETVARALPWEGEAFTEVARAVCMEKKRPDLPAYDMSAVSFSEDEYRDFGALIERCWAGDAAERPTLEEIRQALERLVVAMV